MKRFKSKLDEKHEAERKRQVKETARRRYLKTPEGIAYKAMREEQSAIWRAEWEHLERERKAINLIFPPKPVLVVTGGRNWCEVTDIAKTTIKTMDEALIERRGLAWVLDVIAPSRVIHGGARGADRWCMIWCERRGVECVEVPADWSLGHQAGPARNQLMIDEHAPTAGVVFPGGAGSADCHRRMVAAGLPVFVAAIR